MMDAEDERRIGLEMAILAGAARPRIDEDAVLASILAAAIEAERRPPPTLDELDAYSSMHGGVLLRSAS